MVIDKRNRMNEGQGQLEKNSDDVHDDDDMYQVLKVRECVCVCVYLCVYVCVCVHIHGCVCVCVCVCV